MENEIWKPIVSFEGLYEVSNYGNVRSLNYRNKKTPSIIGQQTDPLGYRRATLHKNGKREKCYVHRLVAEAFIPNPSNLPQVNHKDECKTNNVWTNLEWCDASYNINYGSRNEKMAKSNSIAINSYKNGVFVKRYNSMTEAQVELSIHRGNIWAVLHGKYKQTHGGYTFEYA